MINKESSKHRLLAIAAIIVVTLLAVNAFLLFNKYNQDQIIDNQRSEIEEADKLRIELEKQYYVALSDLEELRNSSAELNTIIDQQKEELRQQRLKINALLSTKGNLDKARIEINNLTSQVKEYISRIETLKAENESLKNENQQLVGRAQNLTDSLTSQVSINEQLSDKNYQLESSKNQLTKENTRLADRVNLASVIKVKDITVTGMKERSNGKMVKKRYAKNVDQLRVCFATEANEIAETGIEEFFVRIINPIGETMAIDDLGAGVLVDKSTGEEVRYTSSREQEYSNSETEVCYNWNPNIGNFQSGTYQVEIYNKGHLSGTSSFELK